MKRCLGLVASLILSSVAELHAVDSAKPNILFIDSDDQSNDALSIVQSKQDENGRFPWRHGFQVPEFMDRPLNWGNSDRLARDIFQASTSKPDS